MGSFLVQRRLSQNATRLKSLRAELAQIDEQLWVVRADADDEALRSLVSETPDASRTANEARKHADALQRHRDHVAGSIVELERRQDELLDRLSR